MGKPRDKNTAVLGQLEPHVISGLWGRQKQSFTGQEKIV
jgi:hypothetical protein